MAESFDDATQPLPTAETGTFTWHVPDGWHQGRGAWGGLPVGAMVRAVEQVEPDARRGVRSISAQITAPVRPGVHTIAVRQVRIGSQLSTWDVSVKDSSAEVVAAATVIAAAARSSKSDAASRPLLAPSAPPADQVPVVETPPPFPEFTRHLEYRVVEGFPLQGGPAQTLGWIDYGTAVTCSAASLLALVDAWYTVTIVTMTELVPVSTVGFTATLLIDPASLAPGTPLLHHGLISGAREGFASEQRRLWTPDGRLAVDNLQTMVVG